MASRRRSDPSSTPASFYPTSPTVSRDSRATRASSLFPYSRPTTEYSTQSWVPAAPILQSRRRPPSNRSSVESSEAGTLEGETPLYARSDWDDDEDPPKTDGSAYSRSSLGMTTAPLGTGRRANTLGDIQEEEEEYSLTDGSTPRNGAAWGAGEMVMSPNSIGADPLTARSTLSYLQESPPPRHKERQRSTGDPWGAGDMVNSPGEMSVPGTATAMLPTQFGNGMIMSPGLMTPYTADGTHIAYRDGSQDAMGKYEDNRKSTLPSVLDLKHLTKGMKPQQRGEDPFADTNSPNLMSPNAQQRLGRMSVAPARYMDDKQDGPDEKRARGLMSPGEGAGSKIAAVPTKTIGGTSRFYQTWRPFINPTLALASALVLTISLQNNPGPMSRYLKVPAGAFAIAPRGVGDVGLGVNGWCPLTGEDCKEYKSNDFSNAEVTYSIPGDPLLSYLGDILTALCALSWLSAMYLLVSAFLHFYLFFILSIPFHHLLDEARLLAPNGGKGKPRAQAEVDIRVRCERPPFEGYLWVWWAWWGHRRAPVGHVFAILVSFMAIASFGIAFGFKQSLTEGTGAKEVSYRAGAFIPLGVFVSSLDPLISAGKWLWNLGYEWNTFLHPPDPSPAAIMLPPTSKPLAHIRNQSGDSFFAPRTTFLDPQTQYLKPGEGDVPPLPGADLDEETRRWLTGYPQDPDLVNLIADLRAGKPNEDFLLSDIGLLYVAPQDDEPALLVPPKGDIRKEIMEDAHHEPDSSGNSEHHDLKTMIELLAETFWWETMKEDVKGYVDGCAGCKYDKGGVGGIAGMKAGMTPVPFTGVTGWTDEVRGGGGEGMKTGVTGVTGGMTAGEDSVMAVEMAYAMRKAEEQAERDRLG